jgi:hypothetical protein
MSLRCGVDVGTPPHPPCSHHPLDLPSTSLPPPRHSHYWLQAPSHRKGGTKPGGSIGQTTPDASSPRPRPRGSPGSAPPDFHRLQQSALRDQTLADAARAQQTPHGRQGSAGSQPGPDGRIGRRSRFFSLFPPSRSNISRGWGSSSVVRLLTAVRRRRHGPSCWHGLICTRYPLLVDTGAQQFRLCTRPLSSVHRPRNVSLRLSLSISARRADTKLQGTRRWAIDAHALQRCETRRGDRWKRFPRADCRRFPATKRSVWVFFDTEPSEARRSVIWSMVA